MKHIARDTKQSPSLGLIHYQIVIETGRFVSLFCSHLRLFKRASQMGPLYRVVLSYGVNNWAKQLENLGDCWRYYVPSQSMTLQGTELSL